MQSKIDRKAVGFWGKCSQKPVKRQLETTTYDNFITPRRTQKPQLLTINTTQ